MEEASAGVGAALNQVSGPLDVRRLQGNARCSRCRDNASDCYLERREAGDLHCLTCKSSAECQFGRVVTREGPASNFSWEELIGDDADNNNNNSNNYPQSTPASRKRKRLTYTDDARLPTYRTWGAREKLSESVMSEPASYNRTHISTFSNLPLPTAETDGLSDYDNELDLLQNTGAEFLWFQNDAPVPLNLNDGLYQPYIPGVVPIPDRHRSLSHGLEDATGQFEGSPINKSLPSLRELSVFESSGSRESDQVPMSYDLAIPSGIKSSAPSTQVYRKLHCPECRLEFNTKSEWLKHMARHDKPFRCTISDCPRRKIGFATRNDLDRHMGSVHRNPRYIKEYKCAVAGCKDPNKVWDRKDNFKAHVKRMHPEVDIDDVVEKSYIEPSNPPKEESSSKTTNTTGDKDVLSNAIRPPPSFSESPQGQRPPQASASEAGTDAKNNLKMRDNDDDDSKEITTTKEVASTRRNSSPSRYSTSTRHFSSRTEILPRNSSPMDSDVVGVTPKRSSGRLLQS